MSSIHDLFQNYLLMRSCYMYVLKLFCCLAQGKCFSQFGCMSKTNRHCIHSRLQSSSVDRIGSCAAIGPEALMTRIDCTIINTFRVIHF